MERTCRLIMHTVMQIHTIVYLAEHCDWPSGKHGAAPVGKVWWLCVRWCSPHYDKSPRLAPGPGCCAQKHWPQTAARLAAPHYWTHCHKKRSPRIVEGRLYISRTRDSPSQGFGDLFQIRSRSLGHKWIRCLRIRPLCLVDVFRCYIAVEEVEAHWSMLLMGVKTFSLHQRWRPGSA